MINPLEWRLAIKIWTVITVVAFVLGVGRLFHTPHITVQSLIAELLVYGLISFGVVLCGSMFWNIHPKPSSRISLRVASYFFMIMAWLVIGYAKGFEFAWDPNTTFQFGSAGRGWESTAFLGGLVGLGLGLLLVALLELLHQLKPRR